MIIVLMRKANLA